MCLLTIVNLILGIFTIPTGKHYVVLANFILLGIFIVPIIPTSMNFASELTFPISSVMTNGVLLMVGQAVGGLLGIVETLIISKSVTISLISYAAINCVAFLCTLVIKEDLRKTKFAQNQTLSGLV